MRVTIVDIGPPYYTIGLANALASLCQVTVVHSKTFSHTYRQLAKPGVVCVAVAESRASSRSAKVWNEKDLSRIIEETRPDLLHVQETFQYSAEVYSAFMRFPILVMTIHDAVAFAQRSHATPGKRSSQALECWRHAHLIVHSAGIRDQLIANSGISLAKIDIIPHGELGSLYKLLAAPEHSRSERDPYGLLFFGNVRRHRGLSVLLEAFKRIILEIPQSHLVICGHGAARLDQYDQLLEGSANVEVGERVVDEDRVYKRLALAI